MTQKPARYSFDSRYGPSVTTGSSPCPSTTVAVVAGAYDAIIGRLRQREAAAAEQPATTAVTDAAARDVVEGAVGERPVSELAEQPAVEPESVRLQDEPR